MVTITLFAEPADMKAGCVEDSPSDTTPNFSYNEDLHLYFDHHASDLERVGAHDNQMINPNEPSAAQVFYEHCSGTSKFSKFSTELMKAVDRTDPAQYSKENIQGPRCSRDKGKVVISDVRERRRIGADQPVPGLYPLSRVQYFNKNSERSRRIGPDCRWQIHYGQLLQNRYRIVDAWSGRRPCGGRSLPGTTGARGRRG